jgi:hypothetical protein
MAKSLAFQRVTENESIRHSKIWETNASRRNYTRRLSRCRRRIKMRFFLANDDDKLLWLRKKRPKALSSKRSMIENVFAKLKKFKILSSVYRNFQKKLLDSTLLQESTNWSLHDLCFSKAFHPLTYTYFRSRSSIEEPNKLLKDLKSILEIYYYVSTSKSFDKSPTFSEFIYNFY